MKTKTVYVVQFKDSWGEWVSMLPPSQNETDARLLKNCQCIRTNSTIKYRIIKRTDEVIE